MKCLKKVMYKGYNLAEQYTYDQFMTKESSVKETNLSQCFSTSHADNQSPYYTVQ